MTAPITIEPWSGDFVDSNDDRAEMVLPFVLAYRRAYYHHRMPGEDEPSEPLNVVLGDMLANMLHLADRTEADSPDEDEMLGADEVIHAARFHYDAEIAEEIEEARWRAEEQAHA